MNKYIVRIDLNAVKLGYNEQIFRSQMNIYNIKIIPYVIYPEYNEQNRPVQGSLS